MRKVNTPSHPTLSCRGKGWAHGDVHAGETHLHTHCWIFKGVSVGVLFLFRALYSILIQPQVLVWRLEYWALLFLQTPTPIVLLTCWLNSSAHGSLHMTLYLCLQRSISCPCLRVQGRDFRVLSSTSRPWSLWALSAWNVKSTVHGFFPFLSPFYWTPRLTLGSEPCTCLDTVWAVFSVGWQSPAVESSVASFVGW